MNRLNGKIAIVTGGAHGIGRAVCELFAEEGAFVFVVDIDEEAGEETAAGIREQGGKALFHRVDVSAPQEVSETVEAAAQEEGHIDILCNNAAYLSEFHDLLGAGQEEWDKSIQVTLMGTKHFTRETLPWMIRQKRGSIVNIVSIQALVGCASSIAYGTVKAALLGFTKCSAYDYGQYNIRVNAICPGPIRTRISPEPGVEMYEYAVRRTILKRYGLPGEVAYASLFLASDESSYITGIELPVDGGWTAT